MRKVQNYEELLKYAYDCLDKSKKKEPLELKANFDYTVTVKGKLWDQFIDWRLAKLITDIQGAVNKALKEADITLTKEEQKDVAVKFRVSKGSSLVEIKFNELLQIVANHMTGGQITAVLITSILVTGGYLTIKRLAARKEATDNENTKRELAKVIEKVVTYEKPFRGLISRLDNKDTVKISSRKGKLSKKEMRQEYPGKSKYRAKNVYLDGLYTIIAIKLEEGTITVEQDGHKLDCHSSLNTLEADELFSKIQNAHAKEEGFDLPLKISGQYFRGSHTIKRPTIYEIGKPRKGSTSLKELLG